ncbi:MAG: ABC transporter permease subunit [Candidatus Cloacimonetes bacterium]|nr:ABC transporter permease [Candidatus Cloacimonadota bacterium]NLO12089.1 ABC transporter permease subunit [Candidatus Cloacimonadota bacterium]
MNPAITIAKKEYSLALRSFTTYIVFVLFLVATGLYFANTALKVGLAEMRGIFDIIHLIFVVYTPAITMGSISKELSSGTFELLSTMPVRLSQILWGKILAAIGLLITILTCTLVYLGLIVQFGVGVDFGAILTGYLGLILAGAVYISIGVFASSLSSNQMLAFILGLAINSIFYLVQFVNMFLPPRFTFLANFISFDSRLQYFFKGVIDTREVVFFLVLIVVFKYLAELKLQSRNMMQEI